MWVGCTSHHVGRAERKLLEWEGDMKVSGT